MMNISRKDIANQLKSCQICGADLPSLKNLHTQTSLDINYHTEQLSEIKIDYLLCTNCGGVSQANIPSEEDLARYYSSCSAHGIELTPPGTVDTCIE